MSWRWASTPLSSWTLRISTRRCCPTKVVEDHGKTTVEDIEGTANAVGSLALARYEGYSAAQYLEETFDVPQILSPTPYGIKNTDEMLQAISKLTGKPIPEIAGARTRHRDRRPARPGAHVLRQQEGRDLRPSGPRDRPRAILHRGRAEPVLLLLGDDNSRYKRDPRILELKKSVPFDMEVICNADLWDLEKKIVSKEIQVDLIMGHSKGRYIAIDNAIPMVRVGFPTFDRAGLYRHPTMGYKGAMELGEAIANALFTHMEYTKNKEWLLNTW